MTNNVGGGGGSDNVWASVGDALKTNIKQIGQVLQQEVDSYEVYQQAGVAPSQDFLNKLNADSPGIPTLRIHYAAAALQILRDPNMTPEQKQAALKQLENTTEGQLEVLGDRKVVHLLTANPWLVPNMMVQLNMNLTEMQQMLKESRMVELEAKLTGMDMVWETGQNIADLTMSAAKAEAAMKFIEGAVGLAQAGANLGIGAMGAKATMNPNGNLNKFMVNAGGGTALSGISSGLGQAVTGFANSGLIMDKAQQERLKGIAETLKQLESQTLQSAGEAMTDLESLLTKALDMMQRIWEQNTKSQQTLTGKPM